MGSYRKNMTPQERERYNAERRAKYAQKHLQSDLAKKVAAGWARRRDPQTKLEEAKRQALADFQQYKREQERKERDRETMPQDEPKQRVQNRTENERIKWREIWQLEQQLERLIMQEEKAETISERNALRFKIFQTRKRITLTRNSRKAFADFNKTYDTNLSYDDNQSRY